MLSHAAFRIQRRVIGTAVPKHVFTVLICNMWLRVPRKLRSVLFTALTLCSKQGLDYTKLFHKNKYINKNINDQVNESCIYDMGTLDALHGNTVKKRQRQLFLWLKRSTRYKLIRKKRPL